MTLRLPYNEPPTDWTQASLRQLFRQALLGDVQAWLASKTEPDLVPTYALVDAGQFHLTEVNLVGLLGDTGVSYEPLLRHTPEAQLEIVGPYLIDLANTTNQALEAIVGLMEYGWTVSFLSSRLPAWKLHTHLRGCLNAELESRTPVQLRFYDPRIMTSLLTIVDAEPLRTALLGPLDTVAGWDRSLQWQAVKGANRQPFRTAQDYFVLPDTLLAALGKAGETDLILNKITAEDIRPGELDMLAPHLQYQIVANLARRARHLGLTSKANIRLFCSIGLRAGITFDQVTPGIAQALASPQQADVRFLAAVRAVNDTEWAALAQMENQQFSATRKRFVDALISRISS